MRFRVRALWLGAVLVLGLACSGRDLSAEALVRLQLLVPGGFTITTVAYQLDSASGATVLAGSFDVTDPNARPSLTLAVPPGSGYTITLRANDLTRTPPHHFEGTSAPFNVAAGQTTLVAVTLTDGPAIAPAPGWAVINGVIAPGNRPPSINSVVVAPAQASWGAPIAISVVASDPDPGESASLRFQWSASPDGTFANPAAASTTYSSRTGGPKVLTLTVVDVHGVAATVSLPVTIVGTDPLLQIQASLGTSQFDQRLFGVFPPEEGVGDETEPPWGPASLPSAAQRQASLALLVRLGELLPASARNSANTGPYTSDDVNVLNALLVLGASPIDLFTGTNLADPAGTALEAFRAAAVSDAAAPPRLGSPRGLSVGASDAALGAYVSVNATDPTSAVGIAVNVARAALLNGLEAQLAALAGKVWDGGAAGASGSAGTGGGGAAGTSGPPPVVYPVEVRTKAPQVFVGAQVAVWAPYGGPSTLAKWTAAPDGVFGIGAFGVTYYSSPTPGLKVITFTTTDSLGVPASASASIEVLADDHTLDPYLALQIAELTTDVDPNLLTAQHLEDPVTFDQIPVGWGTNTLPTQVQRDASAALIRRIVQLLPNSVRNWTNTGPATPTDVNVLNGLLVLGADPLDVFSLNPSSLAAPEHSALEAFRAAAISDAAVPQGFGAPTGIPADAPDSVLGRYLTIVGTDPQSTIGLALNIIKTALTNGLDVRLAALAGQ